MAAKRPKAPSPGEQCPRLRAPRRKSQVRPCRIAQRQTSSANRRGTTRCQQLGLRPVRRRKKPSQISLVRTSPPGFAGRGKKDPPGQPPPAREHRPPVTNHRASSSSAVFLSRIVTNEPQQRSLSVGAAEGGPPRNRRFFFLVKTAFVYSVVTYRPLF